MFKSFFPNPKVFFTSAIVWNLIAVLIWFFGARNWGSSIGLDNPIDGTPSIVGISIFWSKPFLWFYIYFAIVSLVFSVAWWKLAPHKWFGWSVLGSALIIFYTYFQVQVSVAVNEWYGPFYDLIQTALAKPNTVKPEEFYYQLLTFAVLAGVAVIVYAFGRYFINHYVFRWRTAMNEFYVQNWQRLRNVEGASQRVQEDSMRFARGMENQGAGLIDAVMTLIAFMPILIAQSKAVTLLPVVGAVPYPLLLAGLFWAVFGTVFLAAIGYKLPGLEFSNQRVEASFRKELVYGEDDASRASPPVLGDLFVLVRKNYFRLFKNYFLFNLGWRSYLQADNVFGILLLVPTIAAGAITLGVMNQILNAFGQVRDSFLYLVNQWPTIVELISIYKRLRLFESAVDGRADLEADEEYGLTHT